jgi:hypothetical protein
MGRDVDVTWTTRNGRQHDSPRFTNGKQLAGDLHPVDEPAFNPPTGSLL